MAASRAIQKKAVKIKEPKKKMSKQDIKDNLVLYAIMAPVLIFVFIFSYIPIYGIVIAFQDYIPGSSFFSTDVEWVGLEHFVTFMQSTYFWRLIKNTVILNGLNIIFGFVAALGFALLLNEVKALRYKKIVQTCSYLPHFISAVVVASMALTLLAEDGLVNNIITMFGGNAISYSTDPTVFPWVYVITNVWMTFGWNSIIYMATIAGISPELYEAAKMDGANRFQQMWYITIPSIRGTMFILLIFAIGGLMNANSEFILLMYNPSIYETSDVIGTYSYRIGIQQAQFSYTTAIGMFMQIINFAMLYITNAISRKVNGYSLW